MEAQELLGNVAIITGGGTEVAQAVGLALAREGVKICLCGAQAHLLEIAARKIEASGGICLTLESELDSLDQATSVVEYVRNAFERLDILILVSPFWAGGYIHSHNVKTWDRVLAANLREPFLMTRAILPLFRQQKHGEIMVIGSDSALGYYQQDGAYGVAMHALTALMELVRVENAEFGIRTLILSPGVALTVEADSDSQSALTVNYVAEWAIWMLTRPAHLRGSGPIQI